MCRWAVFIFNMVLPGCSGALVSAMPEITTCELNIQEDGSKRLNIVCIHRVYQ